MAAASATWQQTPSPTLATQSTVVSSPQLLAPRITPSPGCCQPNEVVIEISTTLLIQDYSGYYDTPISTFQPAYLALPDGSLTTIPFIDDLAKSYLSLLVTAMLMTIFLRNIIVSLDYIRRATMKRKMLFYLLLCSQLLAMGLVPLLASYFSMDLDCTGVMSVAFATTGVSLALLVGPTSSTFDESFTFCIDVRRPGSRAVLLVLIAFFCASSTFLGLQLGTIRGLRRLSVLYAVWKSRASPAARGRISIRVTLDDFPDLKFDKPTRPARWRHLLGIGNAPVGPPALDVSSGTLQQAPLNSEEQQNPANGVFDSSRHDTILEQPLNSSVEPGARYHTPTSFTSLSRIIPRMELFYKVMKDELYYTTTITATTVVLALLLVFGVNFENNLDMTGWVAANWAVISILVIHSFGRVIRRHEKDALFQHPSAWSPVNHRSPFSRRAFPGQPKVRVDNDPFSDSRGLRESAVSWNSKFSDSPSSPTPVASIREGRLPFPSPYPDIPNNRHTPGTSVDEKRI
ncbi:hypothetical protein DFH07DRAFT_995789 [Mycena maculata]|uniref:Uncharacterized protein n=1 Tax=Mycena maculata TaxID=230809 RepID=A0AAD7P185_9AGAR|nr:hypothetical protein DFH07DRAFT_995789 [Mycena maculata]